MCVGRPVVVLTPPSLVYFFPSVGAQRGAARCTAGVAGLAACRRRHGASHLPTAHRRATANHHEPFGRVRPEPHHEHPSRAAGSARAQTVCLSAKQSKRPSRKPRCAVARAAGRGGAPMRGGCCASLLARVPGLPLLSPASGYAAAPAGTTVQPWSGWEGKGESRGWQPLACGVRGGGRAPALARSPPAHLPRAHALACTHPHDVCWQDVCWLVLKGKSK